MKKIAVLSVGAVLVIAALIVSFIFALGGRNEAPEKAPVVLEGCWTVSAIYQNDIPSFVQDQTMVFDKTQAVMYRDSSGTPYASSRYRVDEAGQLHLPDISREYKVAFKTQNCVRLYENAATYMLLVRNGHAVTAELLAGRWNVVMKGDQSHNGEVLEFEGNAIRYYKSGSEQPVATAEFTLSADGLLFAEKLGLTMNCYRVCENTVILVENSGVVWELSK